ncbi:hypothetical protein [Actinomadura sp. NTSP31]|uniref:hypothetical protein n=1 Tax=Actinomadura sp. NTSP31 TaxID=1735447 RepID=UPI0035C2114D
MRNSPKAAQPDAARHPHDYYYREGMELWPAPETATVSPLLLTRPQVAQFSAWIPVRPVPVQTPLTRHFDDHRRQGDEVIPRNAVDGLHMAHHMILTAGGPTEWTDITIKAAGDHTFSRNPVLRRLQIHAAAPIIGLVAALTGESLVRALLRASPLATARLQPWQSIAERSSTST